jgi:hypothetical protein
MPTTFQALKHIPLTIGRGQYVHGLSYCSKLASPVQKMRFLITQQLACGLNCKSTPSSVCMRSPMSFGSPNWLPNGFVILLETPDAFLAQVHLAPRHAHVDHLMVAVLVALVAAVYLRALLPPLHMHVRACTLLIRYASVARQASQHSIAPCEVEAGGAEAMAQTAA